MAEDALNRVCPCVIRVAGPGGDAVAGNSSRLGGQTVHVEHGENLKTSRRNRKNLLNRTTKNNTRSSKRASIS